MEVEEETGRAAGPRRGQRVGVVCPKQSLMGAWSTAAEAEEAVVEEVGTDQTGGDDGQASQHRKRSMRHGGHSFDDDGKGFHEYITNGIYVGLLYSSPKERLEEASFYSSDPIPKVPKPLLILTHALPNLSHPLTLLLLLVPFTLFLPPLQLL